MCIYQKIIEDTLEIVTKEASIDFDFIVHVKDVIDKPQ